MAKQTNVTNAPATTAPVAQPAPAAAPAPCPVQTAQQAFAQAQQAMQAAQAQLAQAQQAQQAQQVSALSAAIAATTCPITQAALQSALAAAQAPVAAPGTPRASRSRPPVPSYTPSTTFVVAPKAQAITPRNTRQGAGSGMGNAWHSAPTASNGTNTRYAVIQAWHQLGQAGPFTHQQALAAIAGLPLGSGTPQSYFVEFLRQGYLAIAA